MLLEGPLHESKVLLYTQSVICWQPSEQNRNALHFSHPLKSEFRGSWLPEVTFAALVAVLDAEDSSLDVVPASPEPLTCQES